MWWGNALTLPATPWSIQRLFCHVELHLNWTASQLHWTLNHTGNALALGAEPYHEDIRLVGSAIGALPFHLLVVGHGFYTAASARALPFRPYWLLCFWMSLMSGYGGGTITNLLMQEPFLWIRDDLVLPLFAVCWWIIMYSPHDLGYSIFRWFPLKMACRCCAAILRARVIMSRVELAVHKFGARSVAAPLFMGTLGGCGGRLVVDVATHITSPGLRPPELLHPGWLIWSGFAISLAYVSSVHWLPILPQDVAFVVAITSLVGHAVIEEITGSTVDLTAPLVSFFYTLLRIPPPPQHKRTNQGADAKLKGHMNFKVQ